MVWGGKLKAPAFYMAVQIDEKAIFFNTEGQQILKTSPIASVKML